MRIPEQTAEQGRFLKFVIDVCTHSQQRRRELYAKRRRYYQYGQNIEQIVRFNRLKSHLPLLASFLFAADQCAYTVAAPKNADDRAVAQYLALQDDWNEAFQDSGYASAYDQALLWALVYDTMVLKVGWNDVTDAGFCEMAEPSSFGVFREDRPFAAQQAMTHSYYLDYDDAVERMLRAGHASKIAQLQTTGGGEGDTGLPGSLNQMVIAATGGENIMGNISGTINAQYEASPTYRADLSQPVVRFHEVWIWDSEAADWRSFECTDGGAVLSDSKHVINAIKAEAPSKRRAPKYASATNLFLPGDNPFVLLTPYPMYDWIWGDGHIEDLIPLQSWSNERLDQINELLEKQVDPAKMFSGLMGVDDERAAALGGPGTWMYDQSPNAQVKEMAPQIPENLFAEFEEIGALFMEQSGFTDIMTGKGEKNVRGKGHANSLKATGGGRVRKVASGLEESLVRLGDLGMRLKAHNDPEHLKTPDGAEFVAAQVLDSAKYTMRIAGHSHSPLFTSETQELAAALFKAGSINREWFVRMMRPPQEAQLLHSLRQDMKAQAEAAKAKAAAGIAQPGQQHRPRAVHG